MEGSGSKANKSPPCIVMQPRHGRPCNLACVRACASASCRPPVRWSAWTLPSCGARVRALQDKVARARVEQANASVQVEQKHSRTNGTNWLAGAATSYWNLLQPVDRAGTVPEGSSSFRRLAAAVRRRSWYCRGLERSGCAQILLKIQIIVFFQKKKIQMIAIAAVRVLTCRFFQSRSVCSQSGSGIPFH
jgi:hypothetical protein